MRFVRQADVIFLAWLIALLMVWGEAGFMRQPITAVAARGLPGFDR